METIIIKLNPAKMENPDLDIRYVLPDRIEEYTHNAITDNGYDYLTNQELGIWLATKNAKEGVSTIIELLKAETFLDNDLTKSAEIYISQQDSAEISDCSKVF